MTAGARTSMWIPRIFRPLWALLSARQRRHFFLLIGGLFISGFTEMVGMIVLFGFVRGLSGGPGDRKGPLGAVLEVAFGPLEQLSYTLLAGGTVIAFFFTKATVTSLSHFAVTRFFSKLNQRVSASLFEGYLLTRYEALGRRGVGTAMTDVGRIFELFNQVFSALAQLLADAAVVATVAVLLVFVDPILTLTGVLLFGLAGVAIDRKSRRVLVEMGEEENRARKTLQIALKDGMYGLIDGRLNASRKVFVDSYRKALSGSALINRRRDLIRRVPRVSNEALLTVAIVGGVLILTLRGQSLEQVLPTLTIFAFAGLRLSSALSRITKSIQTLQLNAAEFEEFDQKLTEIAPEVVPGRSGASAAERYLSDERPHDPSEGRLKEQLRVDGVSFVYPEAEQPAVKDVTLTVDRGEFVAFCGESGGGKSTLLLLLMGMLTPTEGRVLCDGRPIGHMLSSWHRNIGYVGQNLFISPRSLRENVAFGAPPEEISDEKVWSALELAAAADFVRQLPQGLDTPLKDGGLKLSGGQRQRIIIARALYKDPEILFFDEATAALDNVTEQEITAAIKRLTGKKTILTVAHRLTTIVDADRIYLLQGGRILANGSFDELSASSADFKRLSQAMRREAGKGSMSQGELQVGHR